MHSSFHVAPRLGRRDGRPKRFVQTANPRCNLQRQETDGDDVPRSSHPSFTVPWRLWRQALGDVADRSSTRASSKAPPITGSPTSLSGKAVQERNPIARVIDGYREMPTVAQRDTQRRTSANHDRGPSEEDEAASVTPTAVF